MVERQRLLVEDIDGCASDLFVFKRRNDSKPAPLSTARRNILCGTKLYNAPNTGVRWRNRR
jgi:hypothetical protein